MWYQFVIMCLVVMGVDCKYILGQNGQCGVEASSNLVHHNPWTVFVEFVHKGRLTRTRCAGTLIDSRHVLTAAHCVTKPKHDSMNARLGEYDTDKPQECVQGVCTDKVVTIKVQDVIHHPDFDGKEHDIAILRLEKDAPYTDFIRPACLPSGELKEDATFIAAGWGVIPTRGDYSHIKKIVPLPFFKTDACQSAYGSNILPKSIICAGGQATIDTCSGDSGGPLIWMKETAEVWGITSTGNVHCGTEGTPGIYTKVSDYIDWINTVISVKKM